MKKFALHGLIVAMSALALVGCNDDNDNDNTSAAANNNGMAKEMSTISFSTKNLANLGGDYDYQWWVMNGKPIATPKFDIEEGKDTYSFDVDKSITDGATAFILTIEPQQESAEDFEKASKVHVIAGDVMNNTANATTSHSAALGTDFSMAMGNYFLATPTNGNTTPTQGIWYIDNSSGDMMPGLQLPQLPTGWVYEGWIVDDTPVSTGTFNANADSMFTEADSDGAGAAAAGDKGAPPFPGQDYVNPAMDLVGKTAVISVEPDPDNSMAPFSIKPLLGKIEKKDGVQSLGNIAADTLPSAMISIADK